MAVLGGVSLGLLSILRMFDMGSYVAFDRPFDSVNDTAFVGSAVGLLSDSIGRSGAIVAVVAARLVSFALLALLPLALLRVTRLLTRAYVQVRDYIRDQQAFEDAVADDRFRDTPGRLLTGLRGKDVLLVFVESYGRVALEGSAEMAPVASALAAGTRRLRMAGYSARSSFLTSPTFGGLSWLAHSTLQSGVGVDNQQQYDHLVAGDRFTLSAAFARAGWRTVGVVPANTEDWPQGRRFYGHDTIYDARNVGYAGPAFSYASMPDQYTLAAFRRLELATPHRAPVMVEIDLVSSHTPWAPLPRLVDWDAVGDGSVFAPMPAQGLSSDVVWRDPRRVRAAYAQSIAHSLDALTSFVQSSQDTNLVLVVLGDQ